MKFLHKLLQISQRLYAGASDNIEKAVRQFPSFVSAYASILKELDRDHLDANVLLELSKMMMPFLQEFPSMLSATRRKNYVALIRLLAVLYSKGVAFRNFVDKVVNQGLMFTISTSVEHQSAQRFGLAVEQESKGYVQYCALWHSLLGVSTDPSEATPFSVWNKGLNLDVRQYLGMQRTLFDHLVQRTLAFVKLLDVDTHRQSIALRV